MTLLSVTVTLRMSTQGIANAFTALPARFLRSAGVVLRVFSLTLTHRYDSTLRMTRHLTLTHPHQSLTCWSVSKAHIAAYVTDSRKRDV